MSKDPPSRNRPGNSEPANLEQVIQRIQAALEGGGRVTLGEVLEKIGPRSFGVWFLVAGLMTLAPVVGDIPGVPTLMALFVFLTAVQLLLRRRHFWLPRWLVARSIAARSLARALNWLGPPARFVDRILRPRLAVLVEGAGHYAAALMCLAIALLMPAMELVPFSANGAGAALTAYGLSLTARDGLLALVAHLFTVVTFGTVLFVLL